MEELEAVLTAACGLTLDSYNDTSSAFFAALEYGTCVFAPMASVNNCLDPIMSLAMYIMSEQYTSKLRYESLVRVES